MASRTRTLRIVLTPVNCLAVQSLHSPRNYYGGGFVVKVVFPTCCGVDVHKTFLVATIITTPADSLQPNYQKRRFSTFNSDLNRFADWLLEHNCLDVCMESTGKYWVPVFNVLEKRGIRVVIPMLQSPCLCGRKVIYFIR